MHRFSLVQNMKNTQDGYKQKDAGGLRHRKWGHFFVELSAQWPCARVFTGTAGYPMTEVQQEWAKVDAGRVGHVVPFVF